MSRKYYIWLLFVSFLLGIMAGTSLVKSNLPETIEIKEEGVKDQYAVTDPVTSKVLNVDGGDNPGAYLAFPIYQPKDKMESDLG